MKKTGLIAIGMAVALVAVVLAVARLTGGSSEGGVVVPERGEADLMVQLDGQEALSRGAPAVDAARGGVGDAATGGLLFEEPFGGGGDAPPLPELAGRKIVRDATISLAV